VINESEIGDAIPEGIYGEEAVKIRYIFDLRRKGLITERIK
jgi:hypothetical protein